jgi:hypothetical protein
MMYQPTIATAFVMSYDDYAFFYLRISNDTPNALQDLVLSSLSVAPLSDTDESNCSTSISFASGGDLGPSGGLIVFGVCIFL